MGVEVATYIADLDATLPTATDLRSQGDDHLRLEKTVLKNTFPNASRPWYFPRMTSKSTNYTVLSTEDETIFLVDTSAGNVTLTLPAVIPSTAWQIRVLKVTADANTVSISGTVGGRTLTALATQDDFYHIVGNGTAYYVGGAIKNALLTYAKLQNVSATARLLGRATAGAGVIEELSVGAGLAFGATSLDVTGVFAGLIDASGAAAGQIKFPATQNPSANVNTLDDYEEGTFVPTFSAAGCTFSYAIQAGSYTKVGNRVFIEVDIALNGSGNTLTANALSIAGLPFTLVGNPVVCTFLFASSTTSYVLIQGLVAAAATTIQLYGLTAAATTTTAQNANAVLSPTTGSRLRASLSYAT